MCGDRAFLVENWIFKSGSNFSLGVDHLKKITRHQFQRQQHQRLVTPNPSNTTDARNTIENMARGSNRRRKQSVADKRARPQDSTPKSMVVCMGSETGGAITQLSRDMRHVLEPDTAVRLKERRANKLRDYTTMCGPLGVTHLVLFSRSSAGNASMRVCRTPRGPTLHFRVDQYSLMKDLMKSQKHARAGATSDYQGIASLIRPRTLLT